MAQLSRNSRRGSEQAGANDLGRTGTRISRRPEAWQPAH